jgi:hypothetical protein
MVNYLIRVAGMIMFMWVLDSKVDLDWVDILIMGGGLAIFTEATVDRKPRGRIIITAPDAERLKKDGTL